MFDQKAYYQAHKEKFYEAEKNYMKKNPLKYARSMLKYWTKKVAELEKQEAENAAN